jgi:3-hydroxybutyryl-CoA dehydratase
MAVPAMTPVIGDALPALVVESVDPQRMKTMAAILRDPYPIHWDAAAVASLGLGQRTVNQGPLNLGYIANMLMAWAGDDSIRRLTVEFHARVLNGDRVVAGGIVDAVAITDDGWDATCSVWLQRGTETMVSGTAHVSHRRCG